MKNNNEHKRHISIPSKPTHTFCAGVDASSPPTTFRFFTEYRMEMPDYQESQKPVVTENHVDIDAMIACEKPQSPG